MKVHLKYDQFLELNLDFEIFENPLYMGLKNILNLELPVHKIFVEKDPLLCKLKILNFLFHEVG